jgi:hypothetical protein
VIGISTFTSARYRPSINTPIVIKASPAAARIAKPIWAGKSILPWYKDRVQRNEYEKQNSDFSYGLPNQFSPVAQSLPFSIISGIDGSLKMPLVTVLTITELCNSTEAGLAAGDEFRLGSKTGIA